jgi:hypothetical protein
MLSSSRFFYVLEVVAMPVLRPHPVPAVTDDERAEVVA